MKKKYLAIILIVFCTLQLNAQQLPYYSQHGSSEYLLNPAFTGAKNILDTRIIYRKQWVGFEGAPRTQAVFGHGSFLKNKLGAGTFYNQDKIGPSIRSNFGMSLAYHLKFPDMKLSFGMAAAFMNYKMDGSKITVHNTADIAVDRTVTDKMKAVNLSSGILLHNDRFHFGISIINMQQNALELYKSDSLKRGIIRLEPHHFVSLGYLFSNNSEFIWDNSLLATYVSATPICLDYMLKIHYRETFFFGAGLRLGDAFVFQTGANLGNIQFSYSYDYVISPLKKGTSGSHEIMIGYKTNFAGPNSRSNRFSEFQKQKYHL
jgi:type IX secretion system PorP/SprF family membrane protein